MNDLGSFVPSPPSSRDIVFSSFVRKVSGSAGCYSCTRMLTLFSYLQARLCACHTFLLNGHRIAGSTVFCFPRAACLFVCLLKLRALFTTTAWCVCVRVSCFVQDRLPVRGAGGGCRRHPSGDRRHEGGQSQVTKKRKKASGAYRALRCSSHPGRSVGARQHMPTRIRESLAALLLLHDLT